MGKTSICSMEITSDKLHNDAVLSAVFLADSVCALTVTPPHNLEADRGACIFTTVMSVFDEGSHFFK